MEAASFIKHFRTILYKKLLEWDDHYTNTGGSKSLSTESEKMLIGDWGGMNVY